MVHDSNFRDSGEDPCSSTVICVAPRVASASSVIDELVVRVYSLMRFDGEDASSTNADIVNLSEIGPALVLEADAWWNDHGLSQLSPERNRDLIREIMTRAPIDGALLSIGVFAKERFRLLEVEDIAAMHAWCAQLGSAHRRLALALAGLVIARWYSERPARELEQYLVEQCTCGTTPVLSTALAVCLGLLQTGAAVHASLIFNTLVRMHKSEELAEVEQFGGLLGKLWEFLPAEIEAWLSENGQFISRKVFRLSVERMPSHIRSALTQQWKAHRPLHKNGGKS